MKDIERDRPDERMMMELLTRLHPLHRTLVCDDMDMALNIIGEYLPDAAQRYRIKTYPSGQKVWTWTVPPQYVVHEAYLEVMEGGRASKVFDFKDNPLHLVSYSVSVDRVMSFEELDAHLHTNSSRPNAIPWVFKYYDRTWGFCLPYAVHQKLSRDAQYHVVIRSEFREGFLKVGEYDIRGTSDEYILIIADVCHPAQVNDSISGVVVHVDLLRRLAHRPPGYYNIRFLFLPESIGSITYLANDEAFIPKVTFGIFSEMLGHDNILLLQRTRQDTHVLDMAAELALQRITGGQFRQGPYCHTIIINDEGVTNGPGVDIPTIALNRWPYEEYHTSDDNPSIIRSQKLAEASRVLEEIIRLLEDNIYPRRVFKGPAFLSGLDLHLDWRTKRALKRQLREVMFHLEGNESVLEIARRTGIDYDDLQAFLKALLAKALIKTQRHP